MPYLATRLAPARAETFRWNLGRTPAEYIAKKLRLLCMANITDEDDIVEELHCRLVGAPSLHLHLDKYVTEGGNTVSEYRRTVSRLQDSARREGDIPSALPCPSTRRPPFRESTSGRAHFSDARQGTSTPTNAPTVVSARDAIGSDTGISSLSARTTTSAKNLILTGATGASEAYGSTGSKI